MLTVRELAHEMIATSSNLATNLLVDLVGISEIRRTMHRLELGGLDFRRGVEDLRAWEAGINNRVTANGLLRALRLIAERRAVSEEASVRMLEILHAQEFRRGIPAGLPDDARVAHKTGEISQAAHDAGIVYLPEREPYVVVILTEWDPDSERRQETIAAVSRAVYEHVTAAERASV
jgi:beta-lactamase class A